VIGRPTAPSLVRIDVTNSEHCGGINDFVCTARILRLDSVNVAGLDGVPPFVYLLAFMVSRRSCLVTMPFRLFAIGHVS
jgi:hypothetical protein